MPGWWKCVCGDPRRCGSRLAASRRERWSSKDGHRRRRTRAAADSGRRAKPGHLPGQPASASQPGLEPPIDCPFEFLPHTRGRTRTHTHTHTRPASQPVNARPHTHARPTSHGSHVEQAGGRHSRPPGTTAEPSRRGGRRADTRRHSQTTDGTAQQRCSAAPLSLASRVGAGGRTVDGQPADSATVSDCDTHATQHPHLNDDATERCTFALTAHAHTASD